MHGYWIVAEILRRNSIMLRAKCREKLITTGLTRRRSAVMRIHISLRVRKVYQEARCTELRIISAEIVNAAFAVWNISKCISVAPNERAWRSWK